MSVQVGYKKQVTFFVILFFILLVVVEISVHILEYSEDKCGNWGKESQVFNNIDSETRKQICLDLHSKWEKWENIRLESPNQHFPTININSEGFRGSEISREKPDNTYRIFVVGGSTAFGYGATSDETTISGFLQKKFDEKNLELDVEVINAGIEAAYSSTEAYYIKNTISNFEPDLIISYGGLNDAGDVSIEENIERGKTYFDIRQIIFYKTPFYLWDRLGFYPDNEIVFSTLDNDWISKRTDIWKNHWQDICKTGNEKNFKTVIFVQPMLGSGNKVLSNYELEIQSNRQIQIGVMNSVLNEFAKSLHDLDKECTATGDLRNVFDGTNEPIYYDIGHMSDFGNKIIAEEIFEKIFTIVKKDIRKSIN